jgi:RNA polymerase sigma-70 factor, ECF subfamily
LIDAEVWTKISRGDADAFDAFYQENLPRLCAFLRRVVGDAQVAEDIAQETFLQIWNRPTGFDAERGSLRAYLFGMGRKRAADWWRRRAKVDAIHEGEEEVSRMETGSAVGDAFGRLPMEQRALLWLREVEGQSYAELAVILDVPVGTVRSRLFAAREALRKMWHVGDTSRKGVA